MDRYEAREAIYKVINSGILSDEIEWDLTAVANHICADDFEECPKECLRLCKKDECPNAKVWEKTKY